MTMLLGCIADDFTGATDLANNLVRSGMRTIQTIGVPEGDVPGDIDAVVVALKSRTIPASEAISQSLAALEWLSAAGSRQIYFKYCSTFDSTAAGNIGPVTEALMNALGCKFTIACPAFPENGRTIYQGHLFVGDRLLSESSMRDHPLTPMRDSNLVRVLQAQTRLKVAHIGYDVVARGSAAMRARMLELEGSGVRIAIVDALSDDDLRTIGGAVSALALVTAGSGVAIGLARNFADALSHASRAAVLPSRRGYRAILSGSCSAATSAQVLDFVERGGFAKALDPLDLAADRTRLGEVAAWASERLPEGPVLIYSTAAPEEIARVHEQLGSRDAGAIVEHALAELAQLLVERGVTQLIVAGGETSGAVVQTLGIDALRIGPQIDPGVPWTASAGRTQILLALKSGNFGTPDFFSKAFDLLDRDERIAAA